MKLHVFNPEHDMALAHGGSKMTLPHTIQELKMNLGFLPALWADNGDFVLVDDVMFALKAVSQFRKPCADVLFITAGDLKHLVFTGIEPWGWDKVIRRTLIDAGINADVLPDDDYLALIRALSDRRMTTAALSFLRKGIEDVTCGESMFCATADEVRSALRRYRKIVVKAPWSSSGRGVRYVDEDMGALLEGWISNVIRQQGGVMVEPYYKKVKDFAFEFFAHGNGTVDYCGLSVFDTVKSSYAGNMIATEEEKMAMLSRYLPEELLVRVKLRLEAYFMEGMFGRYSGPLGVDLMIVATADGSGFLLHPCVEINVRRTMGHVANSIKTTPETPRQLMHIVHDVNYKLKFDYMENNFVKVF